MENKVFFNELNPFSLAKRPFGIPDIETIFPPFFNVTNDFSTLTSPPQWYQELRCSHESNVRTFLSCN
jgi:hypothetical protein